MAQIIIHVLLDDLPVPSSELKGVSDTLLSLVSLCLPLLTLPPSRNATFLLLHPSRSCWSARFS